MILELKQEKKRPRAGSRVRHHQAPEMMVVFILSFDTTMSCASFDRLFLSHVCDLKSPLKIVRRLFLVSFADPIHSAHSDSDRSANCHPHHRPTAMHATAAAARAAATRTIANATRVHARGMHTSRFQTAAAAASPASAAAAAKVLGHHPRIQSTDCQHAHTNKREGVNCGVRVSL